MTSPEAKGTIFLIAEEDFPLHFGEWLSRRRQELDLTQAQLAKRASCSVFAIRKIEAGERHPSQQLAGLLAKALEIPPGDQTTFTRVARGELGIEKLRRLPGDAPSAGNTSPIPGNLPRELTPSLDGNRSSPHLPSCCRILYARCSRSPAQAELARPGWRSRQRNFPSGSSPMGSASSRSHR